MVGGGGGGGGGGSVNLPNRTQNGPKCHIR